MITGFHHLTAITKDAEKNKTFYTDILGLRLVKQTVNQDNLTDPHLFYGDYKGTPGTILTFFELPRVGQRHEEDSFIHEVLLKIPQGSLPFWKKHLTARDIRLIENDDKGCTFLDPDDMKISLVEVAGTIAARSGDEPQRGAHRIPDHRNPRHSLYRVRCGKNRGLFPRCAGHAADRSYCPSEVFRG